MFGILTYHQKGHLILNKGAKVSTVIDIYIRSRKHHSCYFICGHFNNAFIVLNARKKQTKTISDTLKQGKEELFYTDNV